MAATSGGAGDSGAPALPPPSHGTPGHLPWLAGAAERRRMLGVWAPALGGLRGGQRAMGGDLGGPPYPPLRKGRASEPSLPSPTRPGTLGERG